MTLTAVVALGIDRHDLTNRVTTSFTLVGHSADSRRLAQGRDPVYGTPPHTRLPPPLEAVGRTPVWGGDALPPAGDV